MTLWLKMIGARDFPLSNEPFKDRPDLETEVRFPKDQPPELVSVGDELVYYAVGGYKGLFAVARIEGPAISDAPHEEPEIQRRWPYAAPVKFRLRLRYVTSGPKLADVKPELQARIHQGVSYFELGRLEFDRAVALLMKAKAAEDLKLRATVRA